MKFTYLALCCCALWTLVSALPLVLLGSEVTPRDSDQSVERRSLYARDDLIRTPTRMLYPRASGTPATPVRHSARLAAKAAGAPPPDVPHELSLKKYKVGTEEEHWALQAHPETAGQGDLHLLHAVSNKANGGVLEVVKENRGPYNPQSSSATTFPVARFPNKAAAMAALDDAHANVAMTGQFPHDNCVDFTCRAAQHMADNGHIPQAGADIVRDQHFVHEATVRAKTSTTTNKANAGV